MHNKAPDKHLAKLFLEYLSWQDEIQKEIFEYLYAQELEIFHDWINEEALLRIIEE